MTPGEIDTMPAGRALDAAVHARVFGIEVPGWESATCYEGEWAVRPGYGASDYASREPVYVRWCVCDNYDPSDPEDAALMAMSPGAFGHRPACLDVVPHYSTDIRAAWAVAERFIRGGGSAVVEGDGHTRYRASVASGAGRADDVPGDSPAHALCRAALKAITARGPSPGPPTGSCSTATAGPAASPTPA